MLSENELSQLCAQVQVISMRVGKFIAGERKKIKTSDIELKGFNNLVSYVDKTAEKYFVEALKEIFPSAGFIAEEDASLVKAERYNWIIDPLDGTTNFLHGVPCFATSVALAENGIPLLGVVFEINLAECFYAWKDGGAWLNGERISVSETPSLGTALIGTGFPYHDFGMQEKYIALFSDLQKSAQGLRRPGSAATDISYVACGRYDAFFEYGLQPWDVAAGTIILQEAGGIVSDFKGENNYVFGHEFVCGNKTVQAELLAKIDLHFK